MSQYLWQYSGLSRQSATCFVLTDTVCALSSGTIQRTDVIRSTWPSTQSVLWERLISWIHAVEENITFCVFRCWLQKNAVRHWMLTLRQEISDFSIFKDVKGVQRMTVQGRGGCTEVSRESHLFLLKKRDKYAACMFAPSNRQCCDYPTLGYRRTDVPSDCDRTHNAVQLGCSILWVDTQRILIRFYRLNVLFTVHHSISVQWNQRDVCFIQFIKN
jgi:hypothetical protein